MDKIRVLIVDDSSLMRNLLSALLSSEPDIEIVGTAPDPYVAREKLLKLQPDVMTLDIEMPKMNGIQFLEKVMIHFPTRTIIFSSLSTSKSEIALRAFELGAIDVLAKPVSDISNALPKMREEIVTRVRMAAQAKLKRLDSRVLELKPVQLPSQPSPSGGTPSVDQTYLEEKFKHKVVAIGSSTGGIEALAILLSQLPKAIPPILIVQHMPANFTKLLAERFQRTCPFQVKEAADGDDIIPGRVLLAPGDFHMEVTSPKLGRFAIRLHQAPPIHNVRPAADYLMSSVAKYFGPQAVGVVLTGMGRDAAKGLLEMREKGSYNIAQDEKTCVVYGMPKVAVGLGAIHKILPIDHIAQHIVDYCMNPHAFKTLQKAS